MGKIIDFFKKFGTWVILAANIAIISLIVANDPDFSEGFRALESLSTPFVALCFVVFSLTYVCEGAQLLVILRMFRCRYPLLKSIRAVIIERYYSAITPTNIGGQPALIVNLIANGLPGAAAASAMSIRFILYQTTLTFFLAALFIAMPLLKISVSPLLFSGLIVGTVVAIGMPVLLLLCAIWPRLTYRLISGFCGLLCRLRLTRDSDKLYGKIVEMLELYSRSMRMIDLRYALVAIVFAVLQFLSVMTVPYLASIACQVEIDFVKSVLYTTILYTAVAYIPTPGASGASEGAFFSLFRGVIPGRVIMVAMLLWRVSSYYLTIVLGIFESGVAALESSVRARMRRKKAGRP